MAYERLMKTGRIQAYVAKPVEIDQLLGVANRDITAAKTNLENSPDWAYTMAYNSVLQASRALMLHEGFRPRGSDQHATVVEFTGERLGQDFDRQVRLFDQMRRKRHRVIYEISGLVSKSEAEQVIDFAREFIELIREQIKE